MATTTHSTIEYIYTNITVRRTSCFLRFSPLPRPLHTIAIIMCYSALLRLGRTKPPVRQSCPPEQLKVVQKKSRGRIITRYRYLNSRLGRVNVDNAIVRGLLSMSFFLYQTRRSAMCVPLRTDWPILLLVDAKPKMKLLIGTRIQSNKELKCPLTTFLLHFILYG